MADSILSSIIGSFYDTSIWSVVNEITNQRCWKSLKIKNVDFDSPSATTASPIFVEKSSDESTLEALIKKDLEAVKVVAPKRIRISAFVDSNSLLSEIIASFKDTKATFKVSSKGVIADSMTILSVELEQNPDMTSAMSVIIDMEKASAPDSGQKFNPSQAADSTTKTSSIQKLPSVTDTITSLATKIGKFIKG